MKISDYPLIDAFLGSIAVYLMSLLIRKLQGEDVSMPFKYHFMCWLPAGIFFLICAIYRLNK